MLILIREKIELRTGREAFKKKAVVTGIRFIIWFSRRSINEAKLEAARLTGRSSAPGSALTENLVSE